jgi:hypothetical protein
MLAPESLPFPTPFTAYPAASPDGLLATLVARIRFAPFKCCRHRDLRGRNRVDRRHAHPLRGPPVLIVARTWEWNTPFMLSHFGWRAALAILASNLAYLAAFRRELVGLSTGPAVA